MVVLLKALADSLRLRLLDVLSCGELTVQDLTTILNLGQSKVSHHLKILCSAGALTVKPQGTWNYYRISEENPLFQSLWPELRCRFEELPEHRSDMHALVAFREQRRQQNLAFFEQHARDWDTLSGNLLPTPAYQERLLELIPQGGRLAELGVGTGSLLVRLKDRCRTLIGIDHSSAMLEEARRRLDAIGAACDLRLGELAHLPLADASLDVVLLNMVLHHAQQPLEVLREVRRVLAPGGCIIIADLARHQDDAVRSSMADIWLGFDASELSAWLQDAGFPSADFESIPANPGEFAIMITVARTTDH